MSFLLVHRHVRLDYLMKFEAGSEFGEALLIDCFPVDGVLRPYRAPLH